jgi:hypothetical protein
VGGPGDGRRETNRRDALALVAQALLVGQHVIRYCNFVKLGRGRWQGDEASQLVASENERADEQRFSRAGGTGVKPELARLGGLGGRGKGVRLSAGGAAERLCFDHRREDIATGGRARRRAVDTSHLTFVAFKIGTGSSLGSAAN